VSSPEPGGALTPLRLAGFALIAVAVIAALVGLITVITDGNGSAAQPPGAPASPDQTASPGQTPSPGQTTSPGQPQPSETSAPPPQTPGPTTTAPTAAPPPAPPPPPPTIIPVRVYNNSTIRGLAARAAADFRRAGWQVEETGNYPNGIIPTSTVYFRLGTPEEAAALALGNRFDLRIQSRFPGIDPASPGLIVIVTNDYGGK
jgi:LytR cell envelope-related transcriptional attenuator